MSQASSPWSFTEREGYLFGWMRQKRNGVVALSVAEFWLGGGCLMFTRHRWTIPNSSNDRDRCSAEFVLFNIVSRYLCRRHNGARVPRFLRSHNIQHHEARAAADDASDCAIRRKTRFNFVFRNSQKPRLFAFCDRQRTTFYATLSITVDKHSRPVCRLSTAFIYFPTGHEVIRFMIDGQD